MDEGDGYFVFSVEEIAEACARLREHLGLSRTQVRKRYTRALGPTKHHGTYDNIILRIENGQHTPRLEKLARHFEVMGYRLSLMVTKVDDDDR